MTVPLYVLATCAMLVGIVFGNWTGLFERHLEKTFRFEDLGHAAGPHGHRRAGGGGSELARSEPRRDWRRGSGRSTGRRSTSFMSTSFTSAS